MAFNSLQYAAFLAAVVVAFWRLRHRRQNAFLVIVSYLFYGLWDWRFLALLMASTAIGYTSGIALDAASDERRRRTILITRVALNLAMLAVFKYANFFVDSFVELAESVGLGVSAPTFQILLPVAISYYTFEEISYAVDIYRRELEPCRDPVAYALFVAFFPKLVAGPILRPLELLPQITNPRRAPGPEQIRSALALIGWGLVKKVVIADSLARYVDEIYATPSTMSGPALIVGTLCFAGQIYGDFSGYSDIARGSSRLLGFELPLNFRQPYLSNSLTAFWRTWHISLSTWLRDYLYIPLGGNQRGPRRTMLNLMTVMVLGGLWHGAGWTYLIWGAIHGTALAAERWARRSRDNSQAMPTPAQIPAITITFSVVFLAWIFFRAPDLTTAGEIVGRILRWQSGEMVWGAALWAAAASCVFLFSDLYERRTQLATTTPASRPRVLMGVLAGMSVAALLVTSGGDPVPFIYFQF